MNCISTLFFSVSRYSSSALLGKGTFCCGSRYACFSPHISFHLYLKGMINIFIRTFRNPAPHKVFVFWAISIALEVFSWIVRNPIVTSKIGTGCVAGHYRPAFLNAMSIGYKGRYREALLSRMSLDRSRAPAPLWPPPFPIITPGSFYPYSISLPESLQGNGSIPQHPWVGPDILPLSRHNSACR